MIIYIVYAVIITILVLVTIISIKAINRGIEAKKKLNKINDSINKYENKKNINREN